MKYWREDIFAEWNSDGKSFYTVRMVRNDRYKFIYSPFGEWELYDLQEDPAELCNLLKNSEGKEMLLDRMGEILLKWMEKTGDFALETAKQDFKK